MSEDERPSQLYNPTSAERKRSWLFLASIPVIIAITVYIWSLALARHQNVEIASQPVPVIADSAKVYVGIYTLSIGNINFDEKSFEYDGYIWLRFKGDTSRGQVEMMNGRGAMQVDFNLIDSRTLNGGWEYRAYHTKGLFRATFDLRHFPFDVQDLSVEIENPLFESKDLTYVMDSASFSKTGNESFGLEKGLALVDYTIASSHLSVIEHVYSTDFGIPETAAGQSRFSRAAFTIHLVRKYQSYLIKFLLPLLIILGVTYIVFFIPPENMEINAGICITALLTAVALGISQSEPASSAGYFMTTDRFFMLSYAMILLTFVELVVVYNAYRRDRAWTQQLHRWGRDLFFPLYLLGLMSIALYELLG
jgi:hypothetical protein